MADESHDCSEMAKVPSSSASTSSSSNTNSGKQDDVITDVRGHVIKNVNGPLYMGCYFPYEEKKTVVARAPGDKDFEERKEDRNWKSCTQKLDPVCSNVRPTPPRVEFRFKVAVDASLSATAGNNSSWLSPSGDFAFGFRQLENNDLFLLSIWFAKIPDKTIVWYANGDRPAPKGSIVNLTANNGLVLTSPQGEQLWKSDQTVAGVVAHGVMNDTGNFVLEDDKSEHLWETFKNPTDTMLPGQIIERGGRLSSRQSETNYARGRFQLDFQEDGNLVFSSTKPFYSTATTTGSVPGSEGLQLVFNDSGNFYILRVNGGHFTFTGDERAARDYYLWSTLSFDGVLAQYFLPKDFMGNASWVPLWSEPPNICQEISVDSGPSICGYNSISTLKADKRPTCECLTGYSLLNPNDPYGSCYPDFKQGCEDELSYTKDLYDVQVVAYTDWLTSSYVQLNASTADKCTQSCLQDCLCVQ